MSQDMGWRGKCLGSVAALALLTHCGSETLEERAGEEDGLSELSQESSTTVTRPASADTYTDAASPHQNFGTGSTLMVDLLPQQRGHLRFEVRGLLGQVTQAKLRLYVTNGTADGPKVFSTPNGWAETGVTWDNTTAPGGRPLDDRGALSSGTWAEYDVTAVVHGNGMHSFTLVADSSDGVDFASRENARSDRRPQLVLTEDTTLDCMPLTDFQTFERVADWDGYASQAEPTRRFGSAPSLLVDAAPTRLESYLKFDLNVNDGWNLGEVKLRLFATDGTSNGPLLYRTTSDWPSDPVLGENFDWNTRPARMGGALTNFGAIASNTWVEHDLTSVVNTPGMQYGFALIPESSDGVDFASNNTPVLERRPSLRITLASDPYCTYRGTSGGLTGWWKHYGGKGPERLHVMATDAQGGFVSAGQFGEAPFPTGEGFALARYTASGTPLWTRQVTTGPVSVWAITVTPEGNLLVVGRYIGAPDLGTGPLTLAPSVPSLFIAKFSPSGQTVWARGFVAHTGLSGEDFRYLPMLPEAVATDAQGSLVVVGNFYGVVDFGGGPLFAGQASIDPSEPYWGGFVAKFTWQGEHVWSKAYETAASEPWPRVRTVSTDAAGNVLLGGRASGLANLGDGPLTKASPFIVKYTPQGAFLWKRLFSHARAGAVSGVRTTSTGGVAFIADLGGTFTFGGVEYTGADDTPYGPDNDSGFVGTLSATGADGWIRPTYPAELQQLATGSDGSITISGHGYLIDLGGGALGTDTILGTNAFVAQYTAAGAHRWSRLFDRNFEGSLGYAPVLHLAPRPGGSVLLGTDFSTPVRFDGTTYTPRGSADLFYFQLTP